MNKFSYRKRAFLSPLSTGFTSYVLAEVGSSEGGEYTGGHYMLTLADCHRRIELEFCLTTARIRRQSLAKIDLLIEVLNEFRTALMAEVQLIHRARARTEAAGRGKGKGEKELSRQPLTEY